MTQLDSPISLQQALSSSTSIALFGGVLLFFSGLTLSLFGHLQWWSVPLGIVCGVLMYGVAYVLTVSLWRQSKPIHDLLQKLHDLFQHFSWTAIVLVSLMAGIGEELLLRGVVQTWLVTQLNPWLGIFIASFVFGLMHYLSLAYIAITFFIGALFGVLYYLTDSLLLVMIAHAVYDVCAFAMIVKFPEYLGVINRRLKVA